MYGTNIYHCVCLTAVTIVTKFALYMYCRRYDTPSTQALATDHVNDTVSNAFALMFGALGGCIGVLIQIIELCRHHCCLPQHHHHLLLLPISPQKGPRTDPGVSLSPVICVKEMTESATLNPLCYPQQLLGRAVA